MRIAHPIRGQNDLCFLFASALLGLLFSISAAAAAQFSFAALGDIPYQEDEEPRFVRIIAQMNREPLAFAMHVGDFKAAYMACTDETFVQRRDWFALSHHAFVFVPGDNEWSDCWRPRGDRRDPLERLAKLRELFFPEDKTLGQRPLAVERQTDRGYPEHLRWQIQDVLFATLNAPGFDNNRRMPEESKRRSAAQLDWTRAAFRIAREKKLPGLVIALQANVFTGSSAWRELVDVLAAEAQAYAGEVLIVHGDTHWFRFDQPLVDRKTGRAVTNVTRLEVFGSPFVDWVYVTVRTEEGRVRFSVAQGSNVVTERNR